nr:putative reverse transcriptase domain-containing protein [Tanacetum cinerariifolium]
CFLVVMVFAFTAGGLSGRFSDSYRLLFTCMLVLGSLLYCFMVIVRFHCHFAGLSGCHEGGVVFERAEVTLKQMRIWLCGVCFKTNTLRTKCRHGTDFMPALDIGDGVFRFVLYDLTKPLVPSCSQLDNVDGLLHEQHDGFTLSFLDSLFSNGLRTLVRETLAKSSSHMVDVDEGDLRLSEQNLKQCKRKICDGHYTAAVRVLSSSGVAPYNDATLQELKAKHPFKSAPSLPDMNFNIHHLIFFQDVVLDRIKSFPRGRLVVGMGCVPNTLWIA